MCFLLLLIKLGYHKWGICGCLTNNHLSRYWCTANSALTVEGKRSMLWWLRFVGFRRSWGPTDRGVTVIFSAGGFCCHFDLFLQGSLKPCFHTIAEKKNSDRCDHVETILYNRSDSSDNDRWKSYLSGLLRSLESGFHMIATITELFFSAIKRKTRLSSKYAPRYCCATLVTFKEQYPVTVQVPNFDFLTGCREFRRC